MFHLFLIAILLVAGSASQDVEADKSISPIQETNAQDLDTQESVPPIQVYDSQDLESDESVPPVQVYNLDEVHNHHHDGHHQQKPHDVYLHGVRGYKGQSKVDRIVTEFNNPDYIEPITVLDYRYLKTGGRDYTRGAGGQILILPKNVRINQKKEFENYDELLEFLRIKQLAEIQAHHKELSNLGYDHSRRGYYEHRAEVNGQYNNAYYNSHDYQQRYGQGGYGGYKRDVAEPTPKKESVE